MSNLKTYGVGALVALLVALGVSYSVRSSEVDVDSVVAKVQAQLGAFPGADFLVDILNFNGVEKAYRRQSVRTATGTICSIIPPNGTSTLVAFKIDIHNATATALVLEAGKARGTNTGTSTRLIRSGNDTTGVFALGAQSHNTIRFTETDFSTSTPDAPTTVSDTGAVLNPDFQFVNTATQKDFLNVRIGGAIGSADPDTGSAIPYQNYVPVGSCVAEFDKF